MGRIFRACLVFLVCVSCAVQARAGDRPNVLFIAIDDLRPELGSYGSEIAVTPNLDTLAAEGVLFANAYAQQAICGPSRASIMTGARPDTLGVTHNYTRIRDASPNVVTLPQHFRANGYETVYLGKIFHGKDTDEELSWSRKPETLDDSEGVPKPVPYALAENIEIAGQNKRAMIEKYGHADFGLGRGPAFERADVPDNRYIDGYNTDRAIRTLNTLLEEPDKPFFLALGFKKPHLDWVCPDKYWDLYDENKINLSPQVSAPQDGAAMGLHASFELRVRHGVPDSGPIDDELARTLKHAYLACVSYVDAQIGRMLTALDEAGVRENTIIVVWSDHGWHLGEMGVWGKATNYEIATRVPLIFWTPEMSDCARGRKTKSLVELLDLFPTLVELAGLEPPGHLEGRSLAPLLKAPDREWAPAAFSQFPSPALREWGSIPLRPAMRETYFGPLIEEVEERIKAQQEDKWDRELFENFLTGYSMRTERYRFVAWKDVRALGDEPIFVELYDQENDPTESRNIAARHPDLTAELLLQLNDSLAHK